jgi:hypothetical protein
VGVFQTEEPSANVAAIVMFCKVPSPENCYSGPQQAYFYVAESRPPLWSRGQSSWLQIQRSGFDSRHWQIFWAVVCPERGPLSLVSTTDELLGRKSSGSGIENREYGRRDPSRWPRGTLFPQKFALTWLTSGDRSVGIVRSRTQATEFLCKLIIEEVECRDWTEFNAIRIGSVGGP